MDAAEYDAWCQTPRGGGVGDIEFRLLAKWLALGKGRNAARRRLWNKLPRRWQSVAFLNVVGSAKLRFGVNELKYATQFFFGILANSDFVVEGKYLYVRFQYVRHQGN